MMKCRGFNIVVYIDDIFLAEPSKRRCRQATAALIQLLQKLGFSVNHQKLQSCRQEVKYLGVSLDSKTMKAHLDPAKLAELTAEVSMLNARAKVSKQMF